MKNHYYFIFRSGLPRDASLYRRVFRQPFERARSREGLQGGRGEGPCTSSGAPGLLARGGGVCGERIGGGQPCHPRIGEKRIARTHTPRGLVCVCYMRFVSREGRVNRAENHPPVGLCALYLVFLLVIKYSLRRFFRACCLFLARRGWMLPLFHRKLLRGALPATEREMTRRVPARFIRM